jgi:hypothetical protein
VDLAVGFDEDGSSFPVGFDLPAVFVDETVVKAAEQDQVLQVGGTQIGPVFAVMAVNETSFLTAGGTTSAVPEEELTS